MRIAISAVAAGSGLVLLGLAFFGQPSVYLRQAREEWDALIDVAPPDASPSDIASSEPSPDRQQAQPDRMAEVPPAPFSSRPAGRESPADARAREALADARAPEASADPRIKKAPADTRTEKAPADTRTQVITPEARPEPSGAPAPSNTERRAEGPALAAIPNVDVPRVDAPKVDPSGIPGNNTGPQSFASSPPSAQSAPATGPQRQAMTGLPPVPETSGIGSAQSGPSGAVPGQSGADASALSKLQPEPLSPPPRSPIVELAKRPNVAGSRPPAGPQAARTQERGEPTPEAAPGVSEPRKPEGAKPAPQKLASIQKPMPPPQPAVPRQDFEDAQSVLARLRQLAPSAPPVQQTEEISPPEPRPRVTPPSIPRLAAARAALTNGRIEDARRLLQEVQLQLVFRPVDTSGDDPPSAGKGSADVAHALDALSANDISLSRRYIEAATNDLAGAGGGSPIQQSDRRPSGYAPAYPPR